MSEKKSEENGENEKNPSARDYFLNPATMNLISKPGGISGGRE